MKQSKELTDFYNAYHDWLEAGAPEENEYGFKRCIGLCDNLYYFNGKKSEESFEMKEQFVGAGLDDEFPFGEKEFNTRGFENKQHLDPNRIKWVKAHLTIEVDEQFELV